MKWIRRILISIAIAIFIFLAFYKPNEIDLKGTWNAKKIVLDDKQVFPNAIDQFLTIGNQISINEWGNSISITLDQENKNATYEIRKVASQKYIIKLASNEKSLNGDFNVEIDTIHLGPRAYMVDVKLQSDKSFIHFQKEVIIGPWKPEFPRKGQV